MELIVFVVASAMVLGGAVGVVVHRHPVHCALSLVLTLFGVAVHFVAMEAHFLAAVQVIVYAGAIVVLFLFVIMLLGVDRAEDLRIEPLPIQRPLAAVMGVGIVGLLDRRRRVDPRHAAAVGQLRARRSPARSAPTVPSPTTTPTSASSPTTCSATSLRLRADVGAADRRRRRHGRPDPRERRATTSAEDDG